MESMLSLVKPKLITEEELQTWMMAQNELIMKVPCSVRRLEIDLIGQSRPHVIESDFVASIIMLATGETKTVLRQLAKKLKE